MMLSTISSNVGRSLSVFEALEVGDDEVSNSQFKWDVRLELSVLSKIANFGPDTHPLAAIDALRR
jgi:hypothetical protein